MIDLIFKIVLSLFLDKEARAAYARRSQSSVLKNQLNLERAKTNALMTALNKQGRQNLGISDKRLAKIASALDAQSKARKGL